MSSLSEAFTSVKTLSSLASHLSLSVLSETWKGSWRLHTYDKNTRRAARVQEAEINWIEFKIS